MEPARDATSSRSPRRRRSFRPSVLFTGAAGAALATLIIAITLLLAGASTLIWAIPAGLLTGAALTALFSWRLALPLRQIERLSDLADQAEKLAHRLMVRAAHRPSSQPQEGTRRELQPAGRPDPRRTLTRVLNQLMHALHAERRYRAIVDATGDVVLLLDPLGQIALASRSVEAVAGFSPAELTGQPLARYVHASDLEELLNLLEAADARAQPEGQAARPRLRLRAANDSWRVLEWTVSPWPAGQAGSMLLTGRDVTERVALQQELVHQAQHDGLTGLPNRIALIARLSELAAQASSARPAAVLMIDLDRFKLINDSLGHSIGDELLAQVGARLSSVMRPSDMLARLGGDEFAVVIQTSGLDGAQLVAQRLTSQLEDPFLVGGAQLSVQASIGIAISHHSARSQSPDSATLLSEADIAMYRAKRSRSACAAFELELDQATARRLELCDELRAAIEAGQLVLHYQPIIDIRQARVAGLEALLRWQHTQRGLLLPADFLPLADETGLIGQLSRAVLDQMLGQLNEWIEQGWKLPISINLSPSWLQQDDVAAEIDQALVRHGVPAQLLRVEITEAALLTANPGRSGATLRRLHEMGIQLTLDDFGAGLSSMTHLRTLPIDQLKVDRTFVATMVGSRQDAVIVRAAIGLGHDLGFSVVAEGIEDADTLARVMGAGCSLAQGHYFAAPMPAERVLGWIQPLIPAGVGVPG